MRNPFGPKNRSLFDVDSLRLYLGFWIIFCAFCLLAATIALSLNFFFTANDAVAVIGTVTGLIATVVSTWFGVSSMTSVANRALQNQGMPNTGTAAVPVIASVSPATGDAGDSLTVTGSGFNGATGVKFGDNPAATFSVQGDTQLTVAVPQGTGRVDVTVTGPGGSSAASPSTSFEYPLSVSALSPSTGQAGDWITISGSRFASPTVKFGNVAATGTKLVSSSQIKAQVPAPGSAGDVHVHVTVTDGTASTTETDSNLFSYGSP